jgi:ectoine hydroxylase-related dioxygenase (phytanoyl-CoA dioxygenase family)
VNVAVPASLVRQFWDEGAVCLRGAFDARWVEHLRAAVEEDLAKPGPIAHEDTPAGKTGRFLGDIGLWAVKPAFRAFVEDSPAAEIAQQFLGSRKVNLLYDHLFVKEPGTAERTPWHQDQPYWPVAGRQIVSLWVALDHVDQASSGVLYVKGSHNWTERYRPSHFGGKDPYKDMPGEPFPDIDAEPERYAFLSWDCAPGDCLVHHALTMHGAPGNRSNARRRRAYATRWTGDDVTYAPVPGQPRITVEAPNLEPGDPLEGPVFPRVLPR